MGYDADMQQTILDGKLLAADIERDLQGRVAALAPKLGFAPVLATILVGDDPSSKIYVNMKGNACRRVGLEPRRVELPAATSTAELLAEIDRLNADPAVFGILLQHPVPRQIDERACFDRIALAKDVDGVTSVGYGRMALGEKAFHSATPGGIVRLLEHHKLPLAGKRAVVLGRSAILGKPMAALLLNRDCTVTVCHSRTVDLPGLVGQADIVVAAIGKPDFVKADWLKPGCVLVDAGYHAGGVGDVEKAAYAKASAYTPVPGGVGPMTIATLMAQTVEAAEAARG